MSEVVELCRTLVSIKSLSGEEEQVAEAIREYGKQFFDEVTVDALGNVCLVVNGKEAGKTILFDGHIDTVPVDLTQWQTNPFEMIETESKLFGRGCSDMKGAVASMIIAVKKFSQQNEFSGRIVVSCSVHEETFEGIAVREVSRAFEPDVVIIGEATNLNLNRGQRGRAEIVVETFGKNAHSANPEKGINALNKMQCLLGKINKLTPPVHEVLGSGILVATDIRSSPYPGKSVLPNYCKITFDRRTLVGETKDSVLAPIRSLIEETAGEDPTFSAKVSYAVGKETCYTGEVIEAERFFPAWLFKADEWFVYQPLHALWQAGLPAELTHYSFCTNGSHFAGEANIPTIGFGPSLENLAHIDNEYIEKEQLEKAVIGYQAILSSLL